MERDPNEGVVKLETPTLNYKLRATPQAMFDVCEACGSIRQAYDRAIAGDFRALFAIAQAGTQVSGKGATDLRNNLFSAGMANITPPIVEFLGVLMAGGRRPDEVEPAKSDDEGNG